MINPCVYKKKYLVTYTPARSGGLYNIIIIIIGGLL